MAARLTVWFAVSSFGLVLAVTALLYFGLSQHLGQENDRLLMDRVDHLRLLLGDRPEDQAEIQFEVEWPSRQHLRILARVLDATGRTLYESSGLHVELDPQLLSMRDQLDQNQPAVSQILSSSAGRFQALTAHAAIGPQGDPGVIQVALDLTQQDVLLRAYRARMLPVLILCLAACTFGGFLLSRRGLRPVERIRGAIRQVHSTTLNDRIDTMNLPTELSDFADALNEMLARLQESFERLARLSADIAHELRTPINALRGSVEVALNRPRTVEEYRGMLETCLDECVRLSRTIDSLLFLAKADDRTPLLSEEDIEVFRELESIRDLYEALALDSGVTIRTESTAQLPAHVDRTMFQRAVCNLVENALKHTSRGGEVTLKAQRDGSLLKVEVVDTGTGIPPEDLPHVLEPFYRVDRSRSSHSGGAGLGLAIVKRVADLHGGNVNVRSILGKGTQVTLSLPDSSSHRARAAEQGTARGSELGKITKS